MRTFSLAFLFGVCSSAFAQCPPDKITPPMPFAGERFGKDLAVDGDRMIAGAPSSGGSSSAHVFLWDAAASAWIHEARLVPGAVVPADQAGWGVAIRGDLAVVGAYRTNNWTGAAYVFERNPATGQWSERQRLVASDAQQNDYFGWRVGIGNDTLAISAHVDDDNGFASGSVYIFRMDPVSGSWIESQKLTASDPGISEHFGFALSIDGDRLALGATGDDGASSRTGTAYIFELDPMSDMWVEKQRIFAQDGQFADRFGIRASLDGDRLLVGAPSFAGQELGAAYIFELDGNGTWVERAKLEPSDPEAGAWFGRPVRLRGDEAWITAQKKDTVLGIDAGAVYGFRRAPSTGQWIEFTSLRAADAADDARLGVGLALHGSRVLAGSYDSSSLMDAGAIYQFDSLDCDSLGVPYCPVTLNSTGVPGRLAASGTGSLALDYLRLHASDLPPGQFGYFLVSQTQGNTTPMGSSGVLCLAGNIGRYNALPKLIQGPAGDLTVDLDGLPVNPPVAAMPGDTWDFQCWYRDVNPGPTSNLTDAVSVAFQ